jgi:hypothetical protein
MAFVLYLNNNLLGIFDNENALNTFIKGGIQNNFFHNENIRTEQYIMNSCCKVNFINQTLNQTLNQTSNQASNQTSKERKQIFLQNPEELKKMKEDKELNIKKKEELIKSEDYIKIQQEKIDLVSKINKIKYDKKLMIEKNNLYNEDIKLFDLFTKEKEKNPNFIIPILFELKFHIFDSLTKSNTLSFDTFTEEYEKVKPENNYDMFTSNNYEKTFEKNTNNFEMNFELQI